MKLLILPLLLLCTAAAAQPVLIDVSPGPFSSTPNRLTVFNGQLHFFGNNSVDGNELLRYDGNTLHLVRDIFRGPADCAPNTSRRRMAEVGGKLYFPADNGDAGLELFSYDGGTPKMVSDIAGGPNGSGIDELVALNDKLYFDANNGTNGKELWEFDPALGQAQQLTFINPGTGSDPDNLVVLDGKLYFTAVAPGKGRELFVYAPTLRTQTIVEDIDPGLTGSEPMSLCGMGNRLYFTARTAAFGRELYMYDGSAVQRLTDVHAGAFDGLSPDIMGQPAIAMVGDDVFISAGDGTAGYQLYRYTPGTGAVSLLATINQGGNAAPSGIVYYANKVFFSADGGQGYEPHMYDGQSVTQLADINQAGINAVPADFTVYNGALYFTHFGDKGQELYRYTDAMAGVADGINASAVKVFPNPASANVFLSLNLQQQETINIRLCDAAGRVVQSRQETIKAGQCTIPVSLSGVAQGVYMYSVTDGYGAPMAVGRLVKI